MVTSVPTLGEMEAPEAVSRSVERVMVVDDSRVQRKILSSQLARSGLEVVEAGSAEEALEMYREALPDLVISDWMMPGITGIEFCQALRRLGNENYVYFILLTSKSESAEIARGLDGGADDFLTKPVNGDELRARIAAGERILRMERELTEKNRLLSSTLGELQALYDSLDRDLMEAKKLQQSLVRERHRDFGNSEVTLLLRPSGHVGGDLVGFFPINNERVGLFAIDVSGHGVASALMTARLAGFLSGSSPEQNLALILSKSGVYDGRDPADLAKQLNRVVLKEMQTESYFTLAYADVDLTSGRVALVQAGHPHPVVQRRSGAIEFLGRGGMPIGLFETAGFDTFEVLLGPGDRLFLMSDGITEAEGDGGAQLGEEGLAELMKGAADMNGAGFLETLVWHLCDFAGPEFNDDVSGVFFEYHGPARDSA